MLASDFFRAVKDRLIVSCQALPGTPLHHPAIIAAIALSVEQGGASALRINNAENIREVRRFSSLPVIGIGKGTDRSQIYITPDFDTAKELAEAGADVVAIQATEPRNGRCDPLRELIGRIHAELGVAVMADVSTVGEGEKAMAAGADMVATTLSGYTPQSPRQKEPDLELVRALSAKGFPVIAEGRYRTPEQVIQALNFGAISVVMGTFITMPDRITRFIVSYLDDYYRGVGKNQDDLSRGWHQ